MKGPKMLSREALPLRRVGKDQRGRTIYVPDGDLDAIAKLSLSHHGITGPKPLVIFESREEVFGYLGDNE